MKTHPVAKLKSMQKYTVQRVEDERVIIADEHRSYSLPKAAIQDTLQPGERISLSIQTSNTDHPLTTSMAHELLNQLLAHPS